MCIISLYIETSKNNKCYFYGLECPRKIKKILNSQRLISQYKCNLLHNIIFIPSAVIINKHKSMFCILIRHYMFDYINNNY